MPATPGSIESHDGSIVAERIGRAFGDLKAVDGVDLDVPSGGVFGFLGPNGAGKSTLVRILTTILAPTEGRAAVAGHDIRQDPAAVRRSIGVALQDVGLDRLMTARERPSGPSTVWRRAPSSPAATSSSTCRTPSMPSRSSCAASTERTSPSRV
ncbi:MAG: ATP-binding cassette domain-containing protein [Actinobacteria bacterium]|nr:ATP-binding cassette domain-containing protein [Actinomycetota bacterium]